jgi:hypothetical protein
LGQKFPPGRETQVARTRNEVAGLETAEDFDAAGNAKAGFHGDELGHATGIAVDGKAAGVRKNTVLGEGEGIVLCADREGDVGEHARLEAMVGVGDVGPDLHRAGFDLDLGFD